jgi:hypothetical protein
VLQEGGRGSSEDLERQKHDCSDVCCALQEGGRGSSEDPALRDRCYRLFSRVLRARR